MFEAVDPDDCESWMENIVAKERWKSDEGQEPEDVDHFGDFV